jgi:hypothetical protein
MPSNPDSSIHFRDAELVEYYDENYERSQRHQVAKRDFRRYQWLLGEELKRVSLAEAEAIALWSALNGCNTSHVETLGVLRSAILSEAAEATQDKPGLANLKTVIAAMSPGQWMAVIDACDRVGGEKYHVENLATELKRVGLVK